MNKLLASNLIFFSLFPESGAGELHVHLSGLVVATHFAIVSVPFIGCDTSENKTYAGALNALGKKLFSNFFQSSHNKKAIGRHSKTLNSSVLTWCVCVFS